MAFGRPDEPGKSVKEHVKNVILKEIPIINDEGHGKFSDKPAGFGPPIDPESLHQSNMARDVADMLTAGFEPPALEGYRPDDPGAPPLDLGEFRDEMRRNPLPKADPAFNIVNLANRMIEFDYVNHRGVFGRRKVTFVGMAFGTAGEYYKVPTLLLVGWCHGKRAVRSFDVSKMRAIEVL